MFDLKGLNPLYILLMIIIIIVKMLYIVVVFCGQLSGFGIIFDKSKEKTFIEAKERVENLYFFLMSIMLIWAFNTFTVRDFKYLERELFHFFGWVLAYALFTKFLERRKKLKKSKSSDSTEEMEGLGSEIIEFLVPVNILK